MKCIDKQLLQKYIDCECTSEEAEKINNHLSTCSSCFEKYEQMKKNAHDIKEALGLLNSKNQEIPSFAYPQVHLKRRPIKYLIYSLSAACIILFILIFVDKKSKQNQASITIVQTVTGQVNANQPYTGQEFIIEVIDSKGIKKEFIID